MVVVVSDGASRLLNILENIVKSERSPDKEEISELLSTKSVSFMIEAYSRWPDFSKEGFVDIIANLANTEPVGHGAVLSKLEEGYRSCLSLEKIDLLRQKLQKILLLDFKEAENIALRYLPSETRIKSSIYLAIDTFNPGMVFKGDVNLSILHFNPDSFNFSMLAHELHHSGFQYWIRNNPKLKSLAFKQNKNYEEIAVSMILSLLSEGMANYFITPSMVRAPSKYKKHEEKIRKYERSLNKMLREIHLLLSDCVSKVASVGTCKERLNSIRFDFESILPPVHFIGARIVEMFDKDPWISREDIVNLCKEPSDFFTFYSKVYQKHGFPEFSDEVINHVSALLGKS